MPDSVNSGRAGINSDLPSGAKPSTVERPSPLGWANAISLGLLPLIAAIPLAPLSFGGGWPDTHEDLRYVVLFDHFRSAILDGVLYPRWLPELYGGYGYPTFVFYQPGFFYWTLPFSALLSDPLKVMYLSLYGLSLTGAAGAWLLCRAVGARRTAILGAALFMMTPYMFVNLYVRGDISELMAMLLAPWLLYFLLRLRHQTPGNPWRGLLPALGLAASGAMIVVSHPVVALFLLLVLPGFAIWLGGALPSKARWLFWTNSALSGAAALAASSPYWFGVFQLMDSVTLGNAVAGYYAAEDHVVYPIQLVARGWGFGGSAVGPDDPMSFQLGLPHFLFALGGFIVRWRSRVVQAALVFYLVSILAMVPMSAPMWALPFVDFVQFPWRLLSITAGLLGFLETAKLHVLIKSGILVVCGLLVVGWSVQFQMKQLVPSLSRAELAARRAADAEQFVTWTYANEFLPKRVSEAALAGPRGAEPVLTAAGPAVARPLPGNGPRRGRYRVAAERPVEVVIKQFYFPGWKIRVDGAVVTEARLIDSLAPVGLMRLRLPPGEHVVEAWYDGPPGWLWRNVIAWSIVLLAGLAFVSLNRVRPARKPFAD